MLRAFLWTLLVAIIARVLGSLHENTESFVVSGMYFMFAVASWACGVWLVLEFLIWAWAHM